MTLAKCPDCGGQVSTSADACPHCGCPFQTAAGGPQRVVETQRRGGKYEGCGCLLLMSGLALGMLAAGTAPAPIWVPAAAGILTAVGFAVFLTGRFM